MAQDIDLKLSSYLYDLPSELIAQYPQERRDKSRLLVANYTEDQTTHAQFSELTKYLPKNSTLVFNQSKVIPCRVFGKKPSGGRVEVFFIRTAKSQNGFPVLVKGSGKRKDQEVFYLHEREFILTKKGNEYFGNFTEAIDLLDFLDKFGSIPLPPYIRDGLAQQKDKESYQTVYAKDEGSVAAPTAGLHFTKELIEELKENGHQVAYVTLHVGLGTFTPVKDEVITDHKMHEEIFYIDEENQAKIKSAKGPIISVGTTSLRVLESCYQNGEFCFPKGESSTDIFLHPGKRIKSIQGMITNFHLPGSTLLMLVSTLMGREKMLSIYQEAIKRQYRFFSYGDAMLLLRGEK